MKKLISILVALAMAAMLSVTAFAAGTPNAPGTTTVKITKKVTKAKGLTLPETVFNFTVTPESYDGNNSAETKAAMPEIQGTSITVSGAIDKVDAYRIGNLDFSPIAAQGVKPGVYVYTIDEVDPETVPEGFTYDPNTYTVTATRDAAGNVTLTIQKNGEGEKLNATEEKPVPTGADGTTMTDTMFDNKYTKTATGSDDGSSLVITKAVDEKYGDATYDFPFTLTINGYTGEYTVKKNGTTVENFNGSFNLKAGDKLEVFGLPVGTTYDVSEGLRADNDTEKKYISSVDVLENNTKNDVKSTAYVETATKGQGAIVDDALVTEGNNAANYLNTNQKAKEDDPGNTGILVSNLPYIALALVAIGGLVAYVVVRRKADDEA